MNIYNFDSNKVSLDEQAGPGDNFHC